MSHWYALRIMSRGEFRASEELAEAEIEHFAPTFTRRTRVRYTAGREKQVTLPLLPGYIFAALDFGPHSHHPTALDDCKHVIDVLGICGKPVPVRSAELRQLRLLCDAGHFDQGRQRGQDNRFKDHDPVIIVSGPLAGLRASFRETAGGLRPRSGFVRVAMEMLFGQRDFETDVPLDLVEAA